MKTTTKCVMKTILLALIASSFLAAASKTALALTTEKEITPTYLQKHPQEFSVDVNEGKDGLINFTIKHNVAQPMYHVAHLAIYQHGKLLAESSTPLFGKKHDNAFHVSLSADTVAESKFDISDSSFIRTGEDAVPIPGTVIYRFRLNDFIPQKMIRSAPSK